jgi:hypothetical protein
MFTINSNLTVKNGVVYNTNFFIIDNIFKDPYTIRETIIKNEPDYLWKGEQKPSYNGKYFVDKRQRFQHDSIGQIQHLISNLCKQECMSRNTLFTNMTLFVDRSFNDYKNNFWWPHKDHGYNGIVYMDLENNSGTNLYKTNKTTINNYNPGIEHYDSWKSKEDFDLIYTFESKFNRLVVFDGNIPHGMAIDSDTFFNKPRINLVSFYTNKN